MLYQKYCEFGESQPSVVSGHAVKAEGEEEEKLLSGPPSGIQKFKQTQKELGWNQQNQNWTTSKYVPGKGGDE